MNKQQQFLDNLLINGHVDNRKLAVIGSAKTLPGGETGFCLMCLKQNRLNIYDTDFNQTVGDLLYSIDLTSITDFKSSSFVLNRYIKFTYENFTYKICDFGNAKNFINGISEALH